MVYVNNFKYIWKRVFSQMFTFAFLLRFVCGVLTLAAIKFDNKYILQYTSYIRLLHKNISNLEKVVHFI